MTLLVLAPMAIEEAALRTDGRVLRTGMGPERARIAAARALAIEANNVAIAGLCGGVDPTLRPGGGWDEPWYTGTGFPGDFYLNYPLYRDVFPVMALGRILGTLS